VFVSLAMALAVPIAMAFVVVTVAFLVTFPHPVFSYKVDWLTTGVVAPAVFLPILLMARWHVQVNRLLVNRDGRLHDDNRLTDRKFNRMRPSMTGILGDLTPLKSAA
jgi:hypothetical protein